MSSSTTMTSEERASKRARLAAAHPLPEGKTFAYGTAGFRCPADLLDGVIFRMGVLACLRSQHKGGAVVGVMITASHNPVRDNGVKLVDPMGEMLVATWEQHATALANCPSDRLDSMCAEIREAEGIGADAPRPRVAYGRDTRPSGAALAASLRDGIEHLYGADGVEAIDGGVLTTPQLHYVVRCRNDPAYGEPTEEGYYSKLAKAFAELTEGKGNQAVGRLTVDCANGVGAGKLRRLQKALGELLLVNVCNDGEGADQVLNEGCGADYVKSGQRAPNGLGASSQARCASLDGDADRLVYFYVDDDGKGAFHLLDGDRIAILAAGFVAKRLRAVGGPVAELSLGVVQTAYANGSSTKYLRDQLGIEAAFTATGVKHLHHKALEYDVGVYFEANGHGTVLFSDRANAMLRGEGADGAAATAACEGDAAKLKALAQLRALTELINQTVGDALSDMLMVEAILSVDGARSLTAWAADYADLPNRLSKVAVRDRAVVKTINADTKAVAPAGMQEAIDAACAGVDSARAFVRPSGTEDVVSASALVQRCAGVRAGGGGGRHVLRDTC